MTTTIRLALIAAAMSAFLAFLVISQAMARAGGTEIRLDMLAVDPRDPLLGHYVVIETPLHRLDLNDYGPVETDYTSGDDVYVALHRDDETGAWRATSVHPRHPGDGVVIRGKIWWVLSNIDFSAIGEAGPLPDPERPLDTLGVRYNLERYYASQDEALALERLRDGAQLRLIVSVNASGDAVIKGLEIDGEDRLDRLF